ncbi:1465_t:CDS:2 [Gigaspora margarita]|uniref:1465_t:CDS:1 n=1 Tax=Gigaspora margarita TaxID=4874 RepID=A0ABN7UQI0_GIGMA|nr:1465_t:CDS:2 [Gigaspora margarita]
MNNIESNRNMYDILPQEEVSSTKESWDDMVSQHENYLQANMSIQDTDNGQNNNKTNHIMEPIAKSLGSSLLGSTDTGSLMTDEDPVQTNLQTYRIREAKLEKMKDITVPVYAKPEIYAQGSEKNEIISLTKQKPCDEPMLDNPFSKQHLKKDTSTRSSDIVMETIEKEVEFTTVI